jgi:hypothetical protein
LKRPGSALDCSAIGERERERVRLIKTHLKKSIVRTGKQLSKIYNLKLCCDRIQYSFLVQSAVSDVYMKPMFQKPWFLKRRFHIHILRR